MQENESVKSAMLSAVDDKTVRWVQKTSKDFVKLMSYYKSAMMEVETRFHALNEEHIFEHDRAPVNSIKTRLKTLHSIQEKMARRNIPFSLEEMEKQLHDIAGVRVICAFPEDVSTMANAFLMQEDIVLLERKDYIANPKPNGYRSLHLIVAVPVHLAGGKRMTKVEIQIRTIAMDFWASLEHQLRYKRDVVFTDEMAEELYKCAELSAQLDNRMDTLRKSMQQHKKDCSVTADHDRKPEV